MFIGEDFRQNGVLIPIDNCGLFFLHFAPKNRSLSLGHTDIAKSLTELWVMLVAMLNHGSHAAANVYPGVIK
jgi:hypothetical protein